MSVYNSCRKQDRKQPGLLSEEQQLRNSPRMNFLFIMLEIFYSLVKNREKITYIFLITWSAFRTTPSLSMRNECVVKVKHNLSTTADFLCHGLRHLGLPCGIQNGAEVLMRVQRSVFLNTVPRMGEGDYHVSTINVFLWLGQAFLHCCSLQFALNIRHLHICSDTDHRFLKRRATRS